MHADATAHIDARAGASWLATVGPVERLHLLAALLSRFNHDFRTPLNTIVGWSHLLQRGSVDPARGTHVADVIARNARDQTLMLEAFIEDGRIILDHLPLANATVRIDEIVTQAIERATGAVEARRPALRVRIDTAGAVVDGDSRLLQRLIDRLFVVVARRAHHGGAIDLHVVKDDRWICLALTTAAHDTDWSESDLLELRIGTLMAAVFRGALELLAAPGSAALKLQLPEATRPK